MSALRRSASAWLALCALVLVALATAAAPAHADDATASDGAVIARLSSTVTEYEGGETTLAISRAGVGAVFDGLEGDEGTWRPSGTDRLVVRDLDADGEPEVIAKLFSGGAHCCMRSVIAHWDPSSQTYRLSTRDWADATWHLRDLDADGRPEFVSWDVRWASWGGSYAESGFPIQIWSFREGQLVDVTRAYPALIAQDQRRHWSRQARLRRSGSSIRGALAAYMADAYLLGTERASWKRVYAAYRLRDRGRFFAALRRRLVDFGYRAPGSFVPPVTRVAPEVPVIGCGSNGQGVARRVRPRHCVMHGIGTSHIGYWSIRNLRWGRWGKRVATARGTSVGRQYETRAVIRTPARVRVSGLLRGCDGRLWYSRAQINVGYGWSTVNLSTCPGRPT